MKFDLFCLYWMHGRLGLEELARGGDGRIESVGCLKNAGEVEAEHISGYGCS